MFRAPEAPKAVTPAPEWSVYITSFEHGTEVSKTKVWTGKVGTCPTATNLSEMINNSTAVETLEDLAAQLCKSAPVQAIPGLLSCLSCNYWRSNASVIDMRKLQKLADAESRSVCGYVFQQGDIVWTCRQCAKDPTCVQCDKCFRKSDHEGHEVYFHRASGGGSGCCDCGDEEAWSRVGNCIDHNHPSQDNCTNKDPLENVPPELVRGMRAVLKGSIAVIVSYIIATVRGYCPLDSNLFYLECRERIEPLVARLHNDDVHTYDQVISALRSFGLDPAASEQLTLRVDKEGEAVVCTESHTSLDKVRHAHQRLSSAAGLLFSVAPESVVKLEARVAAVFGWMQSLGGMSDGLRRLITDQLIAELDSTTHCFLPAVVSAPCRSPSFQAELDILNKDYSPSRAFDRRDQFPSVLLHLASPAAPLPKVVLRVPVYTDGARTSLKDDAPTVEALPAAEYETDFKSRLQHPFESCHKDPLAIMLLGSPYLPVTIKRCINDLIIQFQHDLRFKASFSQQFTTLYPALNVLFCRSVGTAELTVFHTSVQVYTANSVVSMMSSDGVNTSLRLLREGPRPLMIMTLLAATLQTVLLDTGCLPCGPVSAPSGTTAPTNSAFLLHHSIRTHRLSHLCRDIEYLTADYGFCTRLLCEDVDPGMLDIWMDVCSMLQCLDSYTRKADVHVEQEDDRWQDAANLILELESVSANIISRALLDQVFAQERSTIAATSSESSPLPSNAPSYAAPIASPHDKAQLAFMREKAALLCAHKLLCSIAAWVVTLPADSGRISTDPCTTFMDLHVGEFYCIEQDSVYAIPNVRGVSSLPVSVHLPLHRMFGKLVHYAACGNVDLAQVVSAACRMSSHQASLFVEHPLRCLVFAAQVSCGMWRRNGYTAANLAYNYGRAPLSKSLRDMDIVALQVAAMALGSDAFLATLTARFELLNTINNASRAQEPVVFPPSSWATIPKAMNTLEYHPALLAEMLKLLIITVTYVPTSLVETTAQKSGEPASEGWKRMLKREIVHQVLSGVQTAGQLQKIKVMVGSTRTVSDAMLMAAVEETCSRRSDDEGSAKILSLKLESFSYFDPEFPSLPNQQQAMACDRVREHVKSQLAARSDPLAFTPLVSADFLPIPHKDFTAVRQVLYCPAMFRLLEVCISQRFAKTAGNVSRPSSLAILSRAVHLLSLQVAFSGDLSDPASARNLPYFRDAFTAAPASASAAEVPQKGSGVMLLSYLAELWQAGDLQDDILYHQGLGWVLTQIYTHSAAGREILLSKGVSFEAAGVKSSASATDPLRSADKGDSAASKMAKQKAAQQRAIEEARRRTASAMAAFSGDMSSDEEDDETEGSTGVATVKGAASEKYEEALPECIVCREKKDTPLGYLCYLQPSNLMRNAHLRSPDCPDLMNVFRVVALNGCKLFSQPNEDAQVLGVLPQGLHVMSENREGRWLRLKAPQKGWCSLYCNAEDAVNPPQDPANPLSGGKMVVNVHPVAELQFSKYGGSRLHASICGHTMHFDCWDLFYAANFARYENNARSTDLLAVDVNRRESLCPLCKSITNTLVPHAASSTKPDAPALMPSVSMEYCTVINTGGAPGAPWSSIGDSLEPAVAALDKCFSRELARGKLSNDGMFHDSCQQQSRFPWDPETADPSVARNVQLLRSQHGVWSAAAYTLLSATCNRIRERALSVDTAQESHPLRLSDLDQSLLKHMLALVWRSPSWMRYYYEFVSKPLADLFQGAHSSVPLSAAPKPVLRPTDQFLAKTATIAELQRSLRSMPYESVAASFYPNTRTVSRIAKLAIEKGVPEHEAWAVLMTPLLAQDLHVISIATVASAANIEAFVGLNQLLCVAKLAQTLLEPALNGQIDYFQDVVEGNAKGNGHSSAGPHFGGKGDCKHAHSSEGGADTTPSKRTKTTDHHGAAHSQDPAAVHKGDAGAALTPTAFDLAISALTELREQVCAAAGVALSGNAPQGWNLLALVLDSFIPYLEYAYHLRSLVFSISGVDASSSQASVEARATVNSSVRSDIRHQHLRDKFSHAEQLLAVWGITSLEELVTKPFFVHLVQQWADHLRAHYASVNGIGDAAGSEAGERSSVEQRTVAASWIPTAPGAQSQSDGSHTQSSWSAQAKRKESSTAAALERITKVGADGLAPAGDGAALNIALRTMLMGIDPSTTLPAASAMDGQQQQHQPDMQSDDGRMEDAMEDQAFANMLAAGIIDDAGGMDASDAEDSDGSEDDEDNDNEDADAMEHYNPLEHASDSDSDHDNDEDDEGYYSMGNSQEFFDHADEIFGAGVPEPFLTMQAPLGGGADNIEVSDTPLASGSDVSAPKKRKPSHWKLQGVYPINPTVDFPASEVNPLAVAAAGEEQDRSTVSYLLLMPVRAPLQGSLTGREPIVGFNGDRLSNVFPDLSHFSVGLRHLSAVFVPLPTIYTDLYQMVKFPSDGTGSDKKTVEDPAICLVCGRVLNAGNKAQQHSMFENPAGECTLHARSCGAGIGVFFLVQQCQVLLIRGSRGVYYPSLYLDSSGEVNEQRGQNKPLFLSTKRYKKLEEMYISHQIGKEIVRKRASAESVIRLNWF